MNSEQGSEQGNGYFGLSAEDLKKNPQCRALVDAGVVAEDGWDPAKQAEAEARIKASKEQVVYQPSSYDSSK